VELFGKPKSPSVSTVKPERKTLLRQFEKSSGVRFKNEALLDLAFCHRSFSNETAQRDNNERLEFLGDSVLGLVVSSHLYRVLTDKAEGDLAKIKSFVVSEEILAGIAKTLGIDRMLLIGRGEEHSGGREKKALLADALEAVFGAYYLDSGFAEAQKFILKLLVPEIEAVLENRHRKDYKTLLQEHAQKAFRTYPRYVLTDKQGPDHDRTFFVQVWLENKLLGSGTGKNKKEAEQQAAGEAYRALTEAPADVSAAAPAH
jgi:ribonuclease-3